MSMVLQEMLASESPAGGHVRCRASGHDHSNTLCLTVMVFPQHSAVQLHCTALTCVLVVPARSHELTVTIPPVGSHGYQVSRDGANGCQPVPGDPDGAGPREDVLPALPDALWHQAPACRRHHPQGKLTRLTPSSHMDYLDMLFSLGSIHL